MKKLFLGLALASFTIVATFAFTTPAKKANTTSYFFVVSSTTAVGSESSATLAFPTAVPPTTSPATCAETDIHDCVLSFPGYKLVGTTYQPSTAPNGGTVITNYSQFVVRDTKN